MTPLVKTIAIKAGTQITSSLKKEAESFLTAILGEPAKSLGGLASDKINSLRYKNLINIVVDAKRRLTAAGLSPREVPLTIIHPALEAASLEGEPSLREMWVNLLANVADPREKRTVLPCFPMIMRELTCRDAQFLSALYRDAERACRRPHRECRLVDIVYHRDELLNIYAGAGLSRQVRLTKLSAKLWKENQSELDIDFAHFELVIATAFRHEILAETTRPDDRSEFSFTQLGLTFVAACLPLPSDR